MKKIALLLITISFFACYEKFEPHKFDGAWLNMNNDDSFSNLPSIIFKNDSAYFSDVYTYTTKAKYQIRNNNITFFFEKDTLTQTFKFKDSTLYVDNYKYKFWGNYYSQSDFVTYDLIGIKTKNKIQLDFTGRFDSGFHVFKTDEKFIKLKINDQILSDKTNIQRFLSQGHRNFNEPLISIIYIGKGITLKDLIECYMEMWEVNWQKAALITDYDFRENSYDVFFDHFQFSYNQLKQLKNTPLPPRPSYVESMEYYLKKIFPKTNYNKHKRRF